MRFMTVFPGLVHIRDGKVEGISCIHFCSLLDHFILERTTCLVDTPVISFYHFNACISAILKPLLLFAEWVFWSLSPANWEWEG